MSSSSLPALENLILDRETTSTDTQMEISENTASSQPTAAPRDLTPSELAAKAEADQRAAKVTPEMRVRAHEYYNALDEGHRAELWTIVAHFQDSTYSAPFAWSRKLSWHIDWQDVDAAVIVAVVEYLRSVRDAVGGGEAGWGHYLDTLFPIFFEGVVRTS